LPGCPVARCARHSATPNGVGECRFFSAILSFIAITIIAKMGEKGKRDIHAEVSQLGLPVKSSLPNLFNIAVFSYRFKETGENTRAVREVTG